MKKTILYFLFIALVTSCTKRIEIEPKPGEQKVVIQAFLYNDSICEVTIAKTTGFLSTTKPPRLTGATVTLADNVGNSEVLTYNPTKQSYEGATITGVINRTYTLTVEVEGNTYTAVSVLPELYKADSIAAYYSSGSLFEEEGWYVKFYGEDDPSKADYYLIKGYSNDTLLNSNTEINFSDDRFLSQNVNGIDLGYKYDPGDMARVDMFSLTKEAYDFYYAASTQLTSDGGFFSTPPANTPSNFNNGAVGFFQCSTRKPLYTTIP